MTRDIASQATDGFAPRAVGPYRLEAVIGSGGMGAVYRAYDRRLERRVAIKHIRPDKEPDANARRRLRREAKAAAALAHPAIVQVFDILEEDDGEWIVMELIEGPSLARRLDAGPLEVSVAVGLAREVAEGLAYAHTQGFVHRDLKTENVMVSPLGKAKILDFGLAKRLAHDEESLTQDGSVVGTSRAMSPEQAQGYKVDARSDLFSLGVLIYECLTGRSPFKADSAVATLTRVCTHRQKPVRDLNPQVPDKLGLLVDRLLEKLPEMRPRSARHAADELASIGRWLERTGAITRGEPAAGSDTIDFVVADEFAGDDSSPAEVAMKPAARLPIRRKLLWALPLAFLLVVLVPTVILPEIRKILSDWLMNPSDPIAGPPEPSLASPPLDLQPTVEVDSGPIRIVVLPFDNLGPQKNAYFAAGLAEEISRRLTSLSGLGVISRTSAVRYADAGLEQIGAALDVAYVLEGTVNWAPAGTGDGPQEVRVTPQLIRVADDLQVWTHAYKSQLDDFLGLQAEIAAAVATRLDLNLQQTERRALEAQGSEVPAAYFAYLRGLDYRTQPQYSTAGLHKAARLFEHAVEKDPMFTEAWSELARVLSLLYFNGSARSQREQAEQALLKAQALDADLPAVRLASAYYRYHVEEDYERAMAEFSAAARDLPYNAEVLTGLGLVNRRLGKFEEATELLAKAFSLDGANSKHAYRIAEIFHGLRDHEAADHWFAVALELAPDYAAVLGRRALNMMAWKGCPASAFVGAEAQGNGDSPLCSTELARQIVADSPIRDDPDLHQYWLRLDLFQATLAEGEEELGLYRAIVDRIESMPERRGGPGEGCHHFWLEALAFERLDLKDRALAMVDSCRKEIEKLIEPETSATAALGRLGIAYAYLGRREEALAAGKLALDSNDRFTGPREREHLAVTFVLLGEHQQAIDQLEQLIAVPYRAAINPTILYLDPTWDPLRNDRRFQDILTP